MVYLLVRKMLVDGEWFEESMWWFIKATFGEASRPRLPHSGPEWNKSSEALQPRCGFFLADLFGGFWGVGDDGSGR